MKNSISIKELKKSYGELCIFDSYTLDIADSVAVMGASGRGKTTLARLIMGLEQADGGNIDFAYPPRFSVVFQEDRLFDGHNAIENVCAVCDKKMPKDKARERAEELLCALLIDKSDHKKPVGSFSGGMRRRVAIARALMAGGDILVLDEAYKGLDASTREICAGVIGKYAKDALILLITHDEREAELTGIERIIAIE